MGQEQDQQRRPALSREALDPLLVNDRPDEAFEATWRRPYRRRLLIVGAVLAVWTAGIEARLAYLQIARHEAYLSKANKQHQDIEDLAPKRAEILDRNGEVLAYSVDADSVVANPRAVIDKAATAKALCDVFSDCSAREIADLTTQLSRPKSFHNVRRGVSPKVARRVMALELPGVRLESETKRYYPKKELAANVLGFVNRDNVGLAGIELAFDSQIRGKAGKVLRINDAHQRSVDRQVQLAPTAGAAIELTIDQTIQHIAEREIKAGVLAQNAVSGTAIVMDPATGEILASATYPTFNANDPGSVTGEQRRNRAVEDIYEPGSTFKIVTAAAAIEEGILSTTDLIDVSAGRIEVSKGRVVPDEHTYGILTFEDVIVKSSNVGAIKAGWLIGAERLNRYVRRFGFGEVLSKDFRGATPGIVWAPEKLDAGALASVSMGYQVSVTPLQMVNAVAAVANGGTLFQPHMVRAVIRDGKREAVAPVPVREVILPATAATLTTVMEAVVERGTGAAAKIEGYQVAGKTGTAQKIINKRYSDSAHYGSFVGFVPSRRPALAIIVLIDQPRRGAYYGGAVAAPVFQKIAAASLRHLGVPVTINPVAPVIISVDATLVGRPASAITTVSNVAYTDDGQVVMPSLLNLGARDAVRALTRAGLTVRVAGDGIVVSQYPEAGMPVEAGDTSVVLHLRLTRPVVGASAGGGGQ